MVPVLLLFNSSHNSSKCSLLSLKSNIFLLSFLFLLSFINLIAKLTINLFLLSLLHNFSIIALPFIVSKLLYIKSYIPELDFKLYRSTITLFIFDLFSL